MSTVVPFPNNSAGEAIRLIAIVPARMASSRFAGKPLSELYGLPMVEHVRRRAILSGAFDEVVVATCDPEIARAVERHGGVSVMTSSHHLTATDRVGEAARTRPCTHVVNVQGDECLVLPEELGRMAGEIRLRPQLPAWNAVGPLQEERALGDRSVVKCIVSVTGKILFCARDCSSVPRIPDGSGPIRQVLGILGYRLDYLERYALLARTPMETAESIDQWRILEHDGHLQGVPFRRSYPGVNLPGEMDEARKILESDPVQQKILKQILGP